MEMFYCLMAIIGCAKLLMVAVLAWWMVRPFRRGLW